MAGLTSAGSPCADQPTIRSRHGVEALAGHLPTPAGVVGDAINAIRRLAAAGNPVVELPFEEPYDIGAEVFRWEVAVALAGAALGVNPFDEPDVGGHEETRS